MEELILHHYDLSPYAEKIRLVMGLKGFTWNSVDIPMIMPKPDLTALTGGYRKTPVLQIGADIYCDTKLIARRLDSLAPDPPLVPKGSEAAERSLTLWGDMMFMTVVTVFLAEDGFFDEEFIEDRRKIFPGGIKDEAVKAAQPSKLAQLRANLDFLEAQLSQSRGYLLGDTVSLADLSVYHPLMFLTVSEVTRALLEPLDAVRGWMERVAAIGHGTRRELDSQQAVEIAGRSEPAPASTARQFLPPDVSLGDTVHVMPEDYARDPVTGALEFAGVNELALRRTDERAGEVVVHFPREDYLCLPAG